MTKIIFFRISFLRKPKQKFEFLNVIIIATLQLPFTHGLKINFEFYYFLS